MNLFRSEETGSIRWSVIISVLVLIFLTVFLLILQPKEPATIEKSVSTTNIINYNYYQIDGKESPLDLLGCKMLEISAGGYALVCPKN